MTVNDLARSDFVHEHQSESSESVMSESDCSEDEQEITFYQWMNVDSKSKKVQMTIDVNHAYNQRNANSQGP